MSSSVRFGKQRVVNQHPSGSKANCWVDPHDPSQAVLYRGASHALWFGLILLVFVGIGCAVMTWCVFGGRKTRRLGLGNEASKGDWLPKLEYRVDGGRIVLRASSSRLGVLGFLIFFAMIWNGIVSIFVFDIVASHFKGDPNWIETFFMIPFVLIGLGVIAGVLYQFLAMFNPKFEFTLDSAELHPGDTVQVAWRIRGAMDRLRKVTVEWIGEESATYQRGTNTHTDTHVFSTQSLYETKEGVHKVQPRGTVELVIPLDSMHSFAAYNNKITWMLRVRGNIARWPDVKADYPVVIAPHEPSTRR